MMKQTEILHQQQIKTKLQFSVLPLWVVTEIRTTQNTDYIDFWYVRIQSGAIFAKL
jgi:hypothetical protein